MFKYLKSMLVLMCLIVCQVLGLYDQLHDLIPHYHNSFISDPINITSSQKINISLPSFDSASNSIALFSLDQKQFIKATSTKNQQVLKQGQLKDVAQQLIKCQLAPPSLSISKTHTSIVSEVASQPSWQQFEDKVYQIIPSRSLIYILNPRTMFLSAFYFNDVSLHFLSEIKLQQPSSKSTIATNSKQDRIYIFTDTKIWYVNTKTILTDIQQVSDMGGFKTSMSKGLDKVISFAEGVFVGMKKMNKIYIFKQQPGEQSYRTITHYRNTKLIPQDIHVSMNTIYVLDLHTGIYIFLLPPSGKPQQFSYIELKTYGNYQFLVHQDTIFVVYNDQGSKIVEIHYDRQKQRGQLVRYYKSNDFITSINVFQTTPSQAYLFIIADDDYLEVYPFNIDPRLIDTLNNCAKIVINQIRHIFHIQSSNFIVITDYEINYLKISINRGELICKTIENLQGKYHLQIKSNISSCSGYVSEPTKHTKQVSEYCQLQQSYLLWIRNPQKTQLENILLYCGLGGFVVAFLAGLMCLIHWRNNKRISLKRLKEQIVKFRNRAKRIQPFVEEEQKSKEIEVQLPHIKLQEQHDDANDGNDDGNHG